MSDALNVQPHTKKTEDDYFLARTRLAGAARLRYGVTSKVRGSAQQTLRLAQAPSRGGGARPLHVVATLATTRGACWSSAHRPADQQQPDLWPRRQYHAD